MPPALTDDDIELEVLHGGIEDLLHHGRKTVDLVDEQHVAGLQVGEHGGQVAGTLQHRAGGGLQPHAHLGGDDVGERGLAKTGRAEHQRVIEALVTSTSGADEDFQLLTHAGLADVLGQRLGADRVIDATLTLALLGGDQAIILHHVEHSRRS